MQPITFGTFGSDEMLSPNPQLASGGVRNGKAGRKNGSPRSPRSPTVTTPSSEAPSFPAPYAI